MGNEISKKYTITILGAIPDNPEQGNVDVEVLFENGEKYTLTFFTIKNIITLMRGYKQTGECKDGLYFSAADMVIVENITKEIITKTIDELIHSKELFTIYKKLT